MAGTDGWAADLSLNRHGWHRVGSWEGDWLGRRVASVIRRTTALPGQLHP